MGNVTKPNFSHTSTPIPRAKSAHSADSPWWTPVQTAEYIGVSVDTIYEACASKGLKYTKVGHSTMRLRKDWTDQWLTARAQTHTLTTK